MTGDSNKFQEYMALHMGENVWDKLTKSIRKDIQGMYDNLKLEETPEGIEVANILSRVYNNGYIEGVRELSKNQKQ